MNNCIPYSFSNGFKRIFPTRYSINAFNCSPLINMAKNKVVGFFGLHRNVCAYSFLIYKGFGLSAFKTCTFDFGKVKQRITQIIIRK